jgi:lipopolysaccharide/colanic/teichoic acid biosynthesis glycosyltransferase
MDMRFLFLKRPFDAGLSALGIMISFPLWIVFGLLIWLEDRGSIFYTQEREGKEGRIFKAYKFRSMIKEAEMDGTPVQAEKNDPRVTPVGRLLRATAMDELPQLWNILKGDMSFVGPRALRPEEVETEKEKMVSGQWKIEKSKKPGQKKEKQKAVALKAIPGYKERQKVRPGLTGMAQIYLPADSPRREKFQYDAYYIKKQSFWFDLRLIFRSFWISFRGKWEEEEK